MNVVFDEYVVNIKFEKEKKNFSFIEILSKISKIKNIEIIFF